MPLDARRILIVGVAGSGKSTVAARIQAATGIRYTEIDDLHWGPGWTSRPDFADRVRDLVESTEWVTEWQYRAVRPLLLERAELVVWLDLPTATTMRRVIRRTLRRRLRRERLWRAELVEPPLRTIFSDPEHIVRWAWNTRHKYRALAERLTIDAPHAQLVQLRNSREIDDWIARLR